MLQRQTKFAVSFNSDRRILFFRREKRLSCEIAYKCVNLLLLSQTDFEWNDSQRAMVLSSFYWLHWAMQLPGGLLARNFGAKCIFGYSNLFMFAMSFVMPFLARWDIKGLIVARALQGFVGVNIVFSKVYLIVI